MLERELKQLAKMAGYTLHTGVNGGSLFEGDKKALYYAGLLTDVRLIGIIKDLSFSKGYEKGKNDIQDQIKRALNI